MLLSSAVATADDGMDFFEAKVRPLLIEHCYECHSAESGESAGDFVIDTAVGIAAGGSHGTALVAGDAGKSLIYQAVLFDGDLQMPPSGKLDQQSIDLLKHWIEIGAPDPRSGPAKPASVSPMDRDPLSHWTFVPPVKPSVQSLVQPSAADRGSDSDRDVIDVWARRAAVSQAIPINPVAEDTALLRRLYFDLTGLPPTPSQIQAYVDSQRPDRYARLVDSLLANPMFAERFGRHWLDVARYADTVGYALGGKERRIQGSERYRDWVIRAFSNDMPYNRMIEHQLAGDRTDPKNIDGNLDAMGFLTLGRRFLSGLDTTDDRIDAITRGLLGLTVACARCHDHKFDPIPTTDYYSLFGILESSQQPEDGASPLMMVDREKVGDRPVLLRGQPGNRGPNAPRQFLTALRKADEPRFSDGSGRWELSQRITATDNPLTARVMVNRLWTHLIGKSLVDSPSDFGFRTDPPAVPEILDDMAIEFADDWSIKKAVRRIVLTRVYRQSTKADVGAIAADSDNRYLARANRKRRDFESLRDSLLSVAGAMDRTIGGPPVEITLPTLTPRRTVYAMIDRQNLPSIFRTFDFASPDTHSPGRYFTTVPQQALFLLNSPQMFALAHEAADSVRRDLDRIEVGSDDTARLAEAMFRRVLSRPPTADESEAAAAFLMLPVADLPPRYDPRSLWTYGVAKLGDRQSVNSLTPFGYFKDNRWQSSEAFPATDENGHAYFSRESGHTPRKTDMAVVRRLTVPFDAEVTVRGQIRHKNPGDGVYLGLWIGDDRAFYANQKDGQREVGPIVRRVQAGQTVDFVVSPGESDNSDTFTLKMTIQLHGDDGQHLETQTDRDFSGPLVEEGTDPLDRLAQLAQVLMMSNEFAFVD
ncbi:PSD1 and planctomycete cytochrome C domain-containing protein [Rubripirellula lacrimiformis]|nr:PSD1 and planctomycete cytochrome C domain-containing protein [Rubripirellula lacrimiformis]